MPAWMRERSALQTVQRRRLRALGVSQMQSPRSRQLASEIAQASAVFHARQQAKQAESEPPF